MIRPDKERNALLALQAVLIHARSMAYDQVPYGKVAEILDDAEILPSFLASETDETENFRKVLVKVAERYKGRRALDLFDGPPPGSGGAPRPPTSLRGA